jgi:EVE domain
VRYWINTVSRDHVRAGVDGGFTQANHGRATVRRLSAGDLIAFYSPRTSYPDGAPLQLFTAIGQVVDTHPFQVEMTPSFHPWRRRLRFLPAHESAIEPLLDSLDFIIDRRRWGFVFRRGLFEISAEDFGRIASAMGAQLEAEPDARAR